MNIHVTIPGSLPGMNEIVDAARAHWGKSAQMKKTYTAAVALCIPNGDKLGKAKLASPVAIYVDWYEPNDKRDIDNITAGAKFILDGLVGRGVIANDDRKHVSSITHRVHTDKKNPRVEVGVYEVRLAP